MSQLWKKFLDLLPGNPLLVGTVQSHNADGTSTVVLPDGATSLRVRGQSVAVNGVAFIQGGEIVGDAPSLTVIQIDI